LGRFVLRAVSRSEYIIALISGRDFVDEALRIQMSVPQATLELAKSA